MTSIGNGLYAIAGATATSKAACFDLDWTLIRPIHGKFPKDDKDWAFLPNRISTLQAYQQAGYTLAIFTNQGYTGAKLIMALQRVYNVIAELHNHGVYPWVFIATLKNEYRKPSIGMWNVFSSYCPSINKEESLYVGDAAGRPQDYDNNDIIFAQTVGLLFYPPEDFFPQNTVSIPETQTLFIFVGQPGSGKTTFYEQNLKPRGWVHVNQDQLKTAAKVKSAVEAALASGKSVAIDATNPSPDKRREYILLAVKYRVPTLIIYFVRNGEGWNKLRPNPVPTIAYNMYYKNLVEPSLELDSVPVIELF